MGKRIRAQRRGRGTSVFRASTHKRVAPANYPPLSKNGDEGLVGIVKRLVHDPGRGTPLAEIRLQDGSTFYNVPAEGVRVGQRMEVGAKAPLEIGNILPLSSIPEGTMIFNIEKWPGDGGRFVRSSGGYGLIISHGSKTTSVRFPSRKMEDLDGRSRATVGVVAAGGRIEKPFIKAGEKYHMMRAKGHKYPYVRGVAMIAALHPFGGGRHKHTGKPRTVARGAPPGRKVGLIAARRTGRSKKSVERAEYT